MAASAISPADPPISQTTPPLCGEPGHVQRIVLAGFMGSGKSTVGRVLAHQLGWAFTDLDACIEARLGLSVPEIFAQHSESFFRAAEVADLRPLLAIPQRVIALGGGAPATPALRALLVAAKHTTIVHLRAPFPVLYERCRLQSLDMTSTGRPLLGDKAEAAQRFGQRLQMYDAVAHWATDAAAGPPDVVASAILERLGLSA